MSLFDNEDGISEVVGALMVFLILIVYLGTIQAYDVPEWNKDIEKQHFDGVYDDFINLRSDIEDVAIQNVPKKGSIDMGVLYPERFMLQNPGQGAYGSITTYPVNINISYSRATGPVLWKNITSQGLIYQLNGISNLPKLVYENGIIIKDYQTANISMDDNQSLFTEDNVFIPVISAVSDSSSSIDTKTIEIEPFPDTANSRVRFETINITVETRYPEVWEKLNRGSKPSGSTVTIQNHTVCPSGTLSCIKIENIPGYSFRKMNLMNLPASDMLDQKIKSGMVSIDDSLMSNRGATGPEGQDIWEKNQGRLDIPSSSNATQFLIQDITLGRSIKKHEHEEDDEHKQGRLKFSVTDTIGHLWTIEIQMHSGTNGSIIVDYVKQKYPKSVSDSSLNVYYGKYNDFTGVDITDTRQIDLTPYYKQLSNIFVPNVLTIDQIDSQILYVNFVIN